MTAFEIIYAAGFLITVVVGYYESRDDKRILFPIVVIVSFFWPVIWVWNIALLIARHEK